MLHFTIFNYLGVFYFIPFYLINFKRPVTLYCKGYLNVKRRERIKLRMFDANVKFQKFVERVDSKIQK